MQNAAQLPESTCVYERYDVDTLRPANDETYIRLRELGWRRADFAGKTVLDVGCNSGLLTIHALHLGAARVHACDVQPALVEFFSQVALEKNLPVTVTRTAFHELRPEIHKADVVLFMEVLHWAVAQGLALRDVVRRLSGLTGETLYLEFPWSVDEPSIRAQTRLTPESYSADTVLDELCRYFGDVQVIRFMRYFGFRSPSKRVLVKAQRKRKEADLLAALPEMHSLDVPLSRGRNESYLLTSPQGAVVAKVLSPESWLSKLPASLRDDLFDALQCAKTLVPPQKVNGRYILNPTPGRSYMLFPFIGPLPSAGGANAVNLGEDMLIELVLNMRRDLRPLPRKLIEALQRQGLTPRHRHVLSPDAGWRSAVTIRAEVRERSSLLLEALNKISEDQLDSLTHADLQAGNFVRDRDGSARVVDLDNLVLGTPYSDGLMAFIWRGASAEALSCLCMRLEKEETRPVARIDVALAAANCLGWFMAVQAIGSDPVIAGQVRRLDEGLAQALRFQQELH